MSDLDTQNKINEKIQTINIYLQRAERNYRTTNCERGNGIEIFSYQTDKCIHKDIFNINLINNDLTQLNINYKNYYNECACENYNLELNKFLKLVKLIMINYYSRSFLIKIIQHVNMILDIKSDYINNLKCIGFCITNIINLPINLQYLNCSDSIIKKINYLPCKLVVLKLSKCDLETNNINLNNFQLPNLEVLKINSNKLQSLKNKIPHVKNLLILECADNKLHDLNLLSEYNKLSKLNCGINQIKKLDNLPPEIKILKCPHNLITNLDNLPSSIEILDCSYNKLTKFDFLPCSLIKLNCSNNPITNLDNLPFSIQTLIINSTPITQINNLPYRLKNLIFVKGNEFNNKINNLPTNLEKIIIINDKLNMVKISKANLN